MKIVDLEVDKINYLRERSKILNALAMGLTSVTLMDRCTGADKWIFVSGKKEGPSDDVGQVLSMKMHGTTLLELKPDQGPLAEKIPAVLLENLDTLDAILKKLTGGASITVNIPPDF